MNISKMKLFSKKLIKLLKNEKEYSIINKSFVNRRKKYTMYNAVELSKYIVTKCVEDDFPISNLQLQKILYYIQKEYLKQGKVAFNDEFEAWQFGPVVPNVYYKFCGFGAMPITSTYENSIEPLENLCIINDVVESKRCLNPWEMVEETHKLNGAWNKIYQNGLGNHKVIPISLIKAEV